MTRWRSICALAAALLLSLAAMPSLAAKRIALVVGNGAYEHTVPLDNPRNDAADMARALQGLGFAVIEGLDLDKDAFEGKLREFARAARGADAALFFYAGHGLQVDGENYLVPIDARLTEEVDLDLEALELRAFLKQMRSPANLVFLDACRDNPLAQDLARSMGASRSTAVGRGLGRVDTSGGTLIAYATQPGNVALDGKGRNSPFTGALLENIAAPGRSVNDLLTSVTDAVATATSGRQQPWTHSSLRKPFYFAPPETRPVAAPASSSPAATAAGAETASSRIAAEEIAAERLFWESVKDGGDAADLEAYRRRYPGGRYDALALNRLQRLQRQSETPAAGTLVSATPPAADIQSDPEAVESSLDLGLADRRSIQAGLASLGFDAGPADGLFGGRTRAALEAWQAAKGEASTGWLTRAEAEVLKAAGDEVRLAEAGKKGRPRQAMKPGRVFRDCEDCPEMVVVPAGSFTMGSPASEEGRGGDNESPQHRVRISQAFAVGKYEVTFAEWEACVDGGGCNGHFPDDKGWGRGRRPAIHVSWDDAQAYVSWLSRKTGKQYRLLSESEWEYAARAGTTGPFHFGETISTAQANYNGNYTYGPGRKGVFRQKTVPVGSFPGNAFGLHDMHGNVWEWVEDCWHDSYDSYWGAPSDGSAWTTGGDCSRRVLRGGSWILRPGGLRSAYRIRNSSGTRYYSLGFRVSRTLTP